MDKIIKNEDGSFTIIKENSETVRLEDLEQELANLERLEEDVNNFNSWVDTLSDDKKAFIQKQYFVIPQELRDKIKALKEI
jgi:hypothetical protein